ncbi:hypothetical protein MKZ15_05650 [Paenibacillus sp. FSL R7-0216]|uniref:hypothetical protein n=1 Tax=Paenibacillus sp. FSL R7-0216 TaxID=2921677 RepID=UPI0030DB430F
MPRKKKDYGFKPFEGTSTKGRHLRITLSMMESKAWKELSVHSIALYIHMKAKFNYDNEYNISFTYAEGEQLMTEQTFSKSLDQLNDLGFIKVIKSGWTTRTATIYGFSDQWKYYGTDKFIVTPRPKRKRKR